MRHDALMEKFLQQLEIRGWTGVWDCASCSDHSSEGRDPPPETRWGDIYDDTQCWVNDAFISKCIKYDTQAVRDWCRSSRPSQGVSDGLLFRALVFNWRGALSSRSANMCRSLNISKSFMKLLSVFIVEWVWRIYRSFHRSTA